MQNPAIKRKKAKEQKINIQISLISAEIKFKLNEKKGHQSLRSVRAPRVRLRHSRLGAE
jgi:hypothetical protein